MTTVKTFDDILLVPLSSSDKSHRIVQLPNGILTLLISDPVEDLASAALCVAAGAYNDPDEIPGLAHFCEHLLLLGSKNFPNPSEFHEVLSKAGGQRNAFTTGDQTCYFFEVPSDSTVNVCGTDEPVFNSLVRMLADVMKEPLFPESMFEREIYAIDNEHIANKSSSGKLLYHGLRLISNKDHPFHRFATGNFFTLNDLPKIKKVNVKEQLKNYFNEYYTPDRMTLVIRGPQSLNLLQKLAVQNFSDVPTSAQRSQKRKRFGFGKSPKDDGSDTKLGNSLENFDIASANSYPTSPFTSLESQNCLIIDSSKNPILRLYFPIKEIQEESYSLFKTAWCNIVGDEGSGSLDEVLKSQGYTLGINAFSQHLARGDEVLVAELRLTNTGAKKTNEIISIVLNHYKDQVFKDSKKLGNFLFEMESIDLLNYIHQDVISSPMKETSSYALTLQQNLKTLNPKNILKGSGNWNCQLELGSKECEEFWLKRGEAFADFVDQSFNVDNLRFVLLGDISLFKSLTSGLLTSSQNTDKYFNIDYVSGKFNPSQFNISSGLNFRVVPNNAFLPKHSLEHAKLHTLLENSSKTSYNSSLSFVTKSSWSSTKASLVEQNGNYEIWIKPEASKVFNSKVFVTFEFVATGIIASPANTMNCEIIADLLKMKLSNKLYASELLNYTWEVQSSLKGDARFGFTVTGYKDGVPILLKIITEEFNTIVKNASFTKDEFRKSRVIVRSRYNELKETNSLALALSGLLVVLEDKIWSFEDRIEALDDLDIEELEVFLEEFKTDNKFLKLVIQGDVDDYKRYSDMINEISGHLNSPSTFAFKEPSTHLIKPGSSYHIIREGGASDPTNSICFFVQTGPRGDRFTEQLTRLLSFLMTLTLLPDLRMKKQLGYAILGGTRILRSTIGLHISIMSGNFTCSYLKRKIDEYILQWGNSFASMSEEEFRSEVIEQYLKSFNKDQTSSGGPESLTSEMGASAGSSNIAHGNSILIHKVLKDDISTDTYKAEDCHELDQKLIQNLTRKQFMEFFNQRVSVSSPTRSQLSVMINSSLSVEETQQQLIRLQLEAFLKMNGLRISAEKVKEIVEKSKGNAAYLLKDLFKYFMSQGESLKLCTIVLKEVVKQVFESVKRLKVDNAGGSPSSTENKSIEIKDIAEFHRNSPVYYIKTHVV